MEPQPYTTTMEMFTTCRGWWASRRTRRNSRTHTTHGMETESQSSTHGYKESSCISVKRQVKMKQYIGSTRAKWMIRAACAEKGSWNTVRYKKSNVNGIRTQVSKKSNFKHSRQKDTQTTQGLSSTTSSMELENRSMVLQYTRVNTRWVSDMERPQSTHARVEVSITRSTNTDPQSLGLTKKNSAKKFIWSKLSTNTEHGMATVSPLRLWDRRSMLGQRSTRSQTSRSFWIRERKFLGKQIRF